MAKQVRFIRDRDITVAPRQVVAYKAGLEALLPDDQADRAIEEGYAELVDDATPHKPGRRKREDDE